METLADLLAAPELRRAATGIISAAVIAFNHKLGLGLDTESVTAIAGIAVTYIATSNWKQTALARAEAEKLKAAAAVTSPAEALKLMGGLK